MFKNLYDQILRYSEHPYAIWILGLIAFAESSVSPIPPDILLIPMMIAKRHKALYIAFICTMTSVIGGVIGYWIGYRLYDWLGYALLSKVLNITFVSVITIMIAWVIGYWTISKAHLRLQTYGFHRIIPMMIGFIPAVVISCCIGYGFYYLLGDSLINEAALVAYQEKFNRWGFFFISIKGFLPIPYKIVAIGSGLAHYDLGSFMLASMIARSSRFLMLAGLIYFFGEPIKNFIERYLTYVMIGGIALIIGAIYLAGLF